MSLEISSIRQQVSELLVVRASGHSSDSQRKYPSYELKNDHFNLELVNKLDIEFHLITMYIVKEFQIML